MKLIIKHNGQALIIPMSNMSADDQGRAIDSLIDGFAGSIKPVHVKWVENYGDVCPECEFNLKWHSRRNVEFCSECGWRGTI